MTVNCFVSCLITMNLPALSLPQRSRLTGGFEAFVCDVDLCVMILGVQVTIGANFFNSPTPLFWKDLTEYTAERQTTVVQPERRIQIQDVRGGSPWIFKRVTLVCRIGLL